MYGKKSTKIRLEEIYDEVCNIMPINSVEKLRQFEDLINDALAKSSVEYGMSIMAKTIATVKPEGVLKLLDCEDLRGFILILEPIEIVKHFKLYHIDITKGKDNGMTFYNCAFNNGKSKMFNKIDIKADMKFYPKTRVNVKKLATVLTKTKNIKLAETKFASKSEQKTMTKVKQKKKKSPVMQKSDTSTWSNIVAKGKKETSKKPKVVIEKKTDDDFYNMSVEEFLNDEPKKDWASDY